MNSLNRRDMVIGSLSLAAAAALGVQSCRKNVEDEISSTRDDLEDGKYIMENGKKLEYLPYLKERVATDAEKISALVEHAGAAYAANNDYHKDVEIDFAQIKKDIDALKVATEAGTLTIPQMQRAWWGLWQIEEGIQNAMRGDQIDIVWLKDEQQTRINPGIKAIQEGVLKKDEPAM